MPSGTASRRRCDVRIEGEDHETLRDGLTLRETNRAGRIGSGGDRPVALTQHDGLTLLQLGEIPRKMRLGLVHIERSWSNSRAITEPEQGGTRATEGRAHTLYYRSTVRGGS